MFKKHSLITDWCLGWYSRDGGLQRRWNRRRRLFKIDAQSFEKQFIQSGKFLTWKKYILCFFSLVLARLFFSLNVTSGILTNLSRFWYCLVKNGANCVLKHLGLNLDSFTLRTGMNSQTNLKHRLKHLKTPPPPYYSCCVTSVSVLLSYTCKVGLSHDFTISEILTFKVSFFQTFFREGSYIQRISNFFDLHLDEEEIEIGWSAQKVSNMLHMLLVVRTLVSPSNPTQVWTAFGMEGNVIFLISQLIKHELAKPFAFFEWVQLESHSFVIFLELFGVH